MGSPHCPQGGSPPLPPTPNSQPCLRSPGVPRVTLLARMTHSCPDETHTLLPQHCQLSPAGHQMAHHITLSPPLAAPAFPQTETHLAHYSHSVPSTLSRPQKHKTSVKGTGKVTGIPRHQVMPGAGLSSRKALQAARHSPNLAALYPSDWPRGATWPEAAPEDWPEARGWPGTRAGPQLGISRRQ